MKQISNLFVAIALTALHANFCLAAAPDASNPSATAPSEVSEQVTSRVLGNMEYLRGFRGTGFHFTAEVITVENGANSEPVQLDVKISEKGYALVEVLEPKNQRGRRTLLRDRDLWLYLPSSSNIIRIAPLQRVFGAASIADVLNVSYLNDYNVQSSRKSTDGKLLQLTLKSKDAGATYAHIDLDYDLATDRPVESRHYTASDRLLKTIQYKAFHDYAGGPKIEKIVIVDGLRASSAVWMKMSEYEKATYPDSMFTKTALSRN
jgi:outer membrane lipoprotein-sorting protein